MTSRTGRKRVFKPEPAQAAAAAQALVARTLTCEGCSALQTWPRPQCRGEKSEHFRTARETYHPRCQFYAVRTKAEVSA
jgi:hypothetical protein